MKKIMILVALILVSYFSAVVGYNLYEPSSKIEIEMETELEMEEQLASFDSPESVSNKAVGLFDSAKITPSTKMTYKYYYTEDQITQVVEDVPAYFLLNLSRESLEKTFPEWSIESFSSEEVILKKTIDGKSRQHYIIKECDGHIAIYYNTQDLKNILKEVTGIPMESLSEDERNNVLKGIQVDGEENLIKFLENYHS
ncbi:MAG: BofC C-terminal domain-containing protein [bacterium]